MEGSASAFPDWAHLPPLVLHLISEKIKSITDYVRFRAVCSPWRSASVAKPCHLPFQLPWLMIPHPGDKQDDGIRLFYDLWQEKMHKIHLPEIIGKMCCASYRGWLLLVARGGTELCLLNPLTRAHVELPLFTIPVNDDSDEELMNCLFSEHMITKITFSSDLTDPNCIIMVVLCRSQGVYFCKVGDFCWTDAVPHPVWKENVLLPVRRSLLQDAAYNNGSVYLLYEVAMVIYDLNIQRLQHYLFKPKSRHVTKFFLVGKSGVYFVAFHSAKGVKESLGQKFELYQVQEQPMVVKRIADTSDIAIFRGGSSDSYHYLNVCADDWDSFDGDCMYVVFDSFGDRGLLDGVSYSIYCAKLDAGKSKPVVLGLGKGLVDFSWMLPEPKIWFQPSLV